MKKNQFVLFLLSPMGRIVVIAVFTSIIYGLIFAGIASNVLAVSGITLAACAYFGWRALNKITPDIFLIMNVGAWAIYFLVKGFLSILVGAFVAPFQIGKMLSDLISEAIGDGNNE